MGPEEMTLRQKIEAMTKEQREEFEERAAIIEFDGKRDRMTAEYLAYLEVTGNGGNQRAASVNKVSNLRQ
jgi:hypothetical protein